MRGKYLNSKNYHYWGQWVAPTLALSFWSRWSLVEYAKNAPKKLDYSISPALNSNGHCLYFKSDFYNNTINELYNNLAKNNRDIIDYIFSCAVDVERRGTILLRHKDQNFLHDAMKLQCDAIYPWTCCILFDYAGSRRMEEIEKKYNLDFTKVLMQIDSDLKPLSFVDREKLFRFKKKLSRMGIIKYTPIVNIKNISKKLAHDIMVYQKETEYMGTHHLWGEPRTINKLIRSIYSVKEDVKLTNKFNFPKEVKEFAQIMVEFSRTRLLLAERMAQLAYAMRPQMTVLAKRFKLNYDDIIYFSYDEFMAVVDGDGSSPNKKELRLRKKSSSVFVDEKGEMIVYSGKKCDELENILLKSKLRGKKLSVVKGSVANEGIVMGKVVIVLSPSDLSKVKKGMILISPATTPDFLSGMEKAAAFVTDTGGITCHAAIVSREMNKPCVIGTKIAMQVFKDGDLVEVDANKGIVKKIS